MDRFVLTAPIILLGYLCASPVPRAADVKPLIADLQHPSDEVRDTATAALQNRADARPWLRRVARSADKDAARRATGILAAAAAQRQVRVAGAIDACIRQSQVDLFIEWHQFWQPKEPRELWPVGPRMGKAALGTFAKYRLEEANHLENAIAEVNAAGLTPYYQDGPLLGRREQGLWHIRTDRLRADTGELIAFASVAGFAEWSYSSRGYRFSLGPTSSYKLFHVVALCADGLFGIPSSSERPGGVKLSNCFVVCRGDAVLPGSDIFGSVLLVDGDIDLTEMSRLRNSTVRASGRIYRSPGSVPQNCTLVEHARDATAPYTFFELADVGLRVADDEEGLVVRAVQPNTPFGNGGLAKGDLVRAVDDVAVSNSEQLRAAVRRALVRQGDCLLTITRGDRSHDLPVFFPLTK